MRGEIIRNNRAPMPRTKSLVSVAVGALTLLAGCGYTQVVGPDRTVGVAITEYRIDPQSVSVSAGSLTIVVHNYGRLTHDLALIRDGDRLVATQPIQPGQSAELTAVVARGKYTMASTIMSDQALGMYGTLTVT
jgi:plastocyanin